VVAAIAVGLAITWPAGAPAPRAAAVSGPVGQQLTGAALRPLATGATTGPDSAVLIASVAPLTVATTTAARTPRQIARTMLRRFGWSAAQFPYLNRLWTVESHWNPRAWNRYSGAYGIPQACPGSKMATAGPHWRTNATTQIRWGLRYIKGRYGSPRRAWQHEVVYGWY
jgi:hypothetical protein